MMTTDRTKHQYMKPARTTAGLTTTMWRTAATLLLAVVTVAAWADPYSWDATTKTLTITETSSISANIWPISIGGSTTINKTDVKHLVIGNGVRSIEDNTFNGCTNLETASISDGVTSFGGSAFYDCTSLKTINIPDNEDFTRIPTDCFSGCTKLTSITLPFHVDVIEARAFYGCSGLTSFPDCHVKTIKECAFYGCSGLTSITIPPTVTSIGENAFASCSNMTTVKIYNQNKSINGSEGIEAGAFANTVKYLIIPTTATRTHDNYFADFRNNSGFYVFYEGTKSQWENATKEGWDWVPSNRMGFPCTVNFDMQGVCANPAPQTVFPVKDLVEYETSPTATGYEFGGWYFDKEVNFNSKEFKGTIPLEVAYDSDFNVTVYAKWTPTYYNVVTFNTGGKGTAPESQKVAMNMKATWPAVPSYHDDSDDNYYYIDGWYTNADCTGDPYDFDTPVVESFTLYAKWVKQTGLARVNITTTFPTGINNAGTAMLRDAVGRTYGSGPVPPGKYTLIITPAEHYYKHSGSITYVDRQSSGESQPGTQPGAQPGAQPGTGIDEGNTPLEGEPPVTFEDVEFTATYQVNVTYQDANIDIQFDEIPFVLEVEVLPEEGGTVTGGIEGDSVTINGAGRYEYHYYSDGNGFVFSFSVKSNEGYRFGIVSLSKKNDGMPITPLATSISYDGDKYVSYSFPKQLGNGQHYVDIIRFEFFKQAITLDEATGASYTNDIENTNVTLKKTIYQGWNTITIPFEASSDSFHGSAYKYTGDENGILNFDGPLQTIEANVPYLLAADSGGDSFTFSGVTLKAADGQTSTGTNYDFVGTYQEATVAQGDYILGEDAFYRSKGGNKVKAYRAYIKAKSDAAAAARLKIAINGEPADINTIDGLAVSNAAIYNLSGQKVEKTQKGIYIQNGKKVVVK